MTTRDKILTKAKIGSIQFIAASASGGGRRRLARYNAIGVDGAELEDLGQDPRVEVLRARLDETVYQQLENLMREGKAVQCEHPLFGVFTGRVTELTYEASPKSLVNCNITLEEDGQHTIQLAPQALSLPDAASAFNAGLDDLDGLEMPSEWNDVSNSFGADTGVFSDFSDTLDSTLAGDALWTDLGSSFDSLTDMADTVIGAVESAIDDLGQAGSEMIDLTLDLINKARKCVDAAQSELATLWEPFTVGSPVSVAELCRDWLGSDDDETVALFLENNPSIIDVNSISEGLELLIPVQL